MNLREELILDFKSELENADFSTDEKQNDSYQFMIDNLDMRYRNKNVDDVSFTIKDLANVVYIMYDLSITLQESYFKVLEYLEEE